MTSNIVEMRPETLKDALGTGVIEDSGDKFFRIRAKNQVSLEDYIGNITWVGRISGSQEPIIIQIYNAISTSGIALTTTDKSEGVLGVVFRATSDPCGNPEDVDYAPFAIFYPKMLARVDVETVYDDSTAITGEGVDGATVYVTGGTIPANTNAVVASDNKFSITIEPQKAGAELLIWQTKNGKSSLPIKIIVQMRMIP